MPSVAGVRATGRCPLETASPRFLLPGTSRVPSVVRLSSGAGFSLAVVSWQMGEMPWQRGHHSLRTAGSTVVSHSHPNVGFCPAGGRAHHTCSGTGGRLPCRRRALSCPPPLSGSRPRPCRGGNGQSLQFLPVWSWQRGPGLICVSLTVSVWSTPTSWISSFVNCLFVSLAYFSVGRLCAD